MKTRNENQIQLPSKLYYLIQGQNKKNDFYGSKRIPKQNSSAAEFIKGSSDTLDICENIVREGKFENIRYAQKEVAIELSRRSVLVVDVLFFGLCSKQIKNATLYSEKARQKLKNLPFKGIESSFKTINEHRKLIDGIKACKNQYVPSFAFELAIWTTVTNRFYYLFKKFEKQIPESKTVIKQLHENVKMFNVKCKLNSAKEN